VPYCLKQRWKRDTIFREQEREAHIRYEGGGALKAAHWWPGVPPAFATFCLNVDHIEEPSTPVQPGRHRYAVDRAN